MHARRQLSAVVVNILLGAMIGLGALRVPVAWTATAAPAVPTVCHDMPLPSSLPFALDTYEKRLGAFLRAECYRLLGWPHDARVRDTGPWISTLGWSSGRHPTAQWNTANYGLHGTVLVYYSPDVYRWMQEREAALRAGRDLQIIGPIADGAMIVKLMLGDNNQTAADFPDINKLPKAAMALMVKDAQGSKDGWFWGVWTPTLPEKQQIDWPPPPNFPFPWMEAGNYCVNCHASAISDFTFSAISHVVGDPEKFTTFMITGSPPTIAAPKAPARLQSHHQAVTARQDPISRVSAPRYVPDPAFLKEFSATSLKPIVNIFVDQSLHMPPETYDHVVSGPDGPEQFLTSDQCVGCHAAGATGLRFDMTVQPSDGSPLINLAPYGEWRASPMGLAGRDPIFFSQLETERAVHQKQEKVIQDLCFHCHGVMGQRQFCQDQLGKESQRCSETGLLGLATSEHPPDRQLFTREMLNAIPYHAVTPEAQHNAKYGALGREGVSCTVCHHVQIDPRVPFGDTFTGDFRLNKPDEVYGPFDQPKPVPMEQTLGITPKYDSSITSSKICGSCHTVVLPVLDASGTLWTPSGQAQPKMAVEQGTYVEWVFSDFRDGGATPQSCQHCHMPKRYPGLAGELAFMIASIQQATPFPETENRRPRQDIDLSVRQGFARHTLVGLNVFLIKMAQQFPEVLGIRIQDPMLVDNGVAPLATAYNAMLDLAENETATLQVVKAQKTATELVADVTVKSLVGHKFPSGVGFRCAFIEFAVLDAAGTSLWMSGRTNSMGVIVDEHGKAVRGEYFWKDNCGVMMPAEHHHQYQPHFQEISRQEQAQIYQELTKDPQGKLTTSFLSIAERLKDNRLLPKGWNPNPTLAESEQLGSSKMPVPQLIEEMQSVLPSPDGQSPAVPDPDFVGGSDSLTYRVPLRGLSGAPASVKATLYYQAIPPFYLQDRFCTTGNQPDTQRLYALAGYLQLDGTRAANWKLEVVSSGVFALTK